MGSWLTNNPWISEIFLRSCDAQIYLDIDRDKAQVRNQRLAAQTVVLVGNSIPGEPARIG